MIRQNHNVSILAAMAALCGHGFISGPGLDIEDRPRGRPPHAPTRSIMRRGPTSNKDHLIGAWSGDGVKPQECRQMRRRRQMGKR